MSLDPDPLAPPDWLFDDLRVKFLAHRARRSHRRRLTLAVLIGATFLAGSLAGRTLASTPRPASVIPASDAADPPAARVNGEPDQTRTEAPALASPSPLPRRKPERAGDQTAAGIASWGYGWAGVVTRLPRGTRITVCGVLGCWSGRSTGYGPAVWTHRVADLSRSVFAAICGAPSKGLCRVTLTW